MNASAAALDILVVEDSPGALRLTMEALRDAGLATSLQVAGDGATALDILHRRPPFGDAPRPGLVLLDLNLPRKNGIEVLEDIRRDPALNAIPVVVLSTSYAANDVARCQALDACCYLVKPMDYESFVTVVAGLKRFWE